MDPPGMAHLEIRSLNRSLVTRLNKNLFTYLHLAYKKQRNYCVKLFGKTKRDFYNSLDVKNITENKLIWKTVKPSFTDKTLKDERITLVENSKVISDEKKLVEIFSEYLW